MTGTTTPPAALSAPALARALAALDHETSPATCPAWDQLDASGIDAYRAAARRLLELVGGGEAVRAECGCDPAPYREADGTYSHWAGCPIADAQQAADEAQQPGAQATRDALIAELLPAWEAVYEPGNVSDYLIGYANDQDVATGMAEAWLRSQAEVTGRLEWTNEEPLATGRYDRWFELVERHADGVDTGPGIVVRRRVADEAQQPEVQS